MINRRNFVAYASAIAAALVSLPNKLRAQRNPCVTDTDVQGPFHRRGAPERTDLAKGYEGNGRKLRVAGRVFQADCTTPIANATIDLWHASPEGQYDQTTEKYMFRGVIKTDRSGSYSFDTLIPKGYKDGPLDRPAHIHFIVEAPKFKKLITQIYFKDDPKLEGDIFIKQNNGHKRALSYPINTDGVHEMSFDIVLDPQA